MLLQQIAMYPVSGGKFINVAGVKRIPGSGPVYEGPWVETTTADSVAKLFEDWQPKALGIIKASLSSSASTAGVGSVLIKRPCCRQCRTRSAGQCMPCASCRPMSRDELRSLETLYVNCLSTLHVERFEYVSVNHA